MRVLLAARWPIGGISTFFRYLYSRPVFDNYRFDLLVPRDGFAQKLFLAVPSDRFKIIEYGASGIDLFFEIRRSLDANGYDLLHTHGLTTATVGQLARAGKRVPHIASIHDVFLSGTFAGAAGRGKQILLNLALRTVDAVHAVSDDCADNFRAKMPLIPNRKIHPILHGIDVERFADADPLDAHGVLGLPREVRLIGFFGRFMAPKGFKTLIDAVAKMNGSQSTPPFRVITFGWGGFVREDFQYIQDLGIRDSFIQLPHTNEPEKWIKSMDIVAMPSKWEACGLLAMEALVAGTPIIGTDCIWPERGTCR